MNGRVIDGKYQLGDLIGSGGMGNVYQAFQLPSGREVAIKILAREFSTDSTTAKRFQQEAMAGSLLKSPNTITVYDFGKTADGTLYIVMELLKGEALATVLKRGPLAISTAITVVLQTCHSLIEAHAQGIIHRDLKPDNIYLTQDFTGQPWIKVLDFGIAKFLETEQTRLTQKGFIIGTPEYLSPEQACGGEVDGRSDIYSLGVIFYKMLSGRPPFIADSPIGLLYQHVHHRPQSLNRVREDLHIPEALDNLILRCLEKDPGKRIQSVQALYDSLQEIYNRLKPTLFKTEILPKVDDSTPVSLKEPDPTPVEVGGIPLGSATPTPRQLKAQTTFNLNKKRMFLQGILLWSLMVVGLVALAFVGTEGIIYLSYLKDAPGSIETHKLPPIAHQIHLASFSQPDPISEKTRPEMIRGVIQTDPEKAQVEACDTAKPLGKTRLTLKLEKSEKSACLLLKYPGYKDKKVSIPLNKSDTYLFSLEKIPPSPFGPEKTVVPLNRKTPPPKTEPGAGDFKTF